MNVYRLADRLHKLPSEIMTMTAGDLIHFIAYTRIDAREQKKALQK